MKDAQNKTSLFSQKSSLSSVNKFSRKAMGHDFLTHLNFERALLLNSLATSLYSQRKLETE